MLWAYLYLQCVHSKQLIVSHACPRALKMYPFPGQIRQQKYTLFFWPHPNFPAFSLHSLIRKCPLVHDAIKFSLHLQQLHKKAVFFDCSGCFLCNYLETILHAVQYSVIAHTHENVLRAQIAVLNLVLKSSNMRQIQKSTFSVKLTRIPFQCVLECLTKYFISSKNISDPPFLIWKNLLIPIPPFDLRKVPDSPQFSGAPSR